MAAVTDLQKQISKLEREVQLAKEAKRKTTEALAPARAAGRRYWLARDIPDGRYAMIQRGGMGFYWGIKDGRTIVTAGWAETEAEAKAALFDVLFTKSHSVEELFELDPVDL